MLMEPKALEKLKNKAKEKVEERRSPVSKDQSTVPIADAMRDFWRRDMLTFSIPAHNGGRRPAPQFTKWLGGGAARPGVHEVAGRGRGPQGPADEPRARHPRPRLEGAEHSAGAVRGRGGRQAD